MPTARIPQLDGLRAVAILAVMAHHLFHIPLLWGGVDLFFVLSGFLITGLLLNSKDASFPTYLARFYARRARRILPAYAAVLLLTAVLFGADFLRWWPYYLGAMNFLKPLQLPMPQTLQPLWSLAVEEQFYLLWPLALFLLPRRALPWLAGALILIAPFLRYVCTPFFSLHWAIYMLLPFRMDSLATGALLALLWPQLTDKLCPAPDSKPGNCHPERSSSASPTGAVEGPAVRFRYRLLSTCLATMTLSLLSLYWLNLHGDTTTSNRPLANFAVYECILLLATALFLLALLGFGRIVLASAPMVALGRISYSMYLVHLTAFDLLAPGHWLLALVATVAYATISWFALESPILRGGRDTPPAILPT